MTQTRTAGIPTGGIAIVALSGCEQIEQAATDAIDEARQTALEAIDEARRAGSVEEVEQSEDNTLYDVRQQAAGLLRQASDLLAGNPPARERPLQETGADVTTEKPTAE